jgi:hypothetical protein
VAPAAVAAGGAEAGDLALQHSHAKVWVGLLEVVRGPQSGESGADDDDVHVGGAGE